MNLPSFNLPDKEWPPGGDQADFADFQTARAKVHQQQVSVQALMVSDKWKQAQKAFETMVKLV